MLCLLTSALAIDVTILRPAAAGWKRTQCGGATGTTDLPTKWASQVSSSEPPLPEYPRPTLVRSPHGIFDRDKGDDTTWRTLNGLWEWQPAASATAPPPFGQTLAGSILVPFPIESCLSGVAPKSSSAYVDRSFYRLVVQPRPAKQGSRMMLRFGAVNWQAAVYLNGALATNHTGGYDGFEVEVTTAWRKASASASSDGRGSTDEIDEIAEIGEIEILIAVFNPADRGAQPNGKARISAISSPGGDTYTPASGLWQSVWLEEVPAVFISRVQIAQNDPTTLTATAHLALPHTEQTDTPSLTPPHTPFHAPSSALNTAPRLDDMMLLYEVLGTAPSQQVIASGSALAGTPLRLTIPEPRLWSPDTPFLYDLRVTCAACGASNSAVVGTDGRTDGRTGGRAALGAHEGGDVVMAYFGLRTFEVDAFPAQRRRTAQAAPSTAGSPSAVSSSGTSRAVSSSGTSRAVSGSGTGDTHYTTPRAVSGYTHYTTLLVGPDLMTTNLSLSQVADCD